MLMRNSVIGSSSSLSWSCCGGWGKGGGLWACRCPSAFSLSLAYILLSSLLVICIIQIPDLHGSPPFRLPPEDPHLFQIFKVLFFLEPLNIFAFILLLPFCWSQHPAHSSCNCHNPTHSAVCTPPLGLWSFLRSADAPGACLASSFSSHISHSPPPLLLSKILLSVPLTPESCTLLTIEQRT